MHYFIFSTCTLYVSLHVHAQYTVVLQLYVCCYDELFSVHVSGTALASDTSSCDLHIPIGVQLIHVPEEA